MDEPKRISAFDLGKLAYFRSMNPSTPSSKFRRDFRSNFSYDISKNDSENNVIKS